MDELGKNQKHTYASQFALSIYPKNSIYSFIPKNACSTMRLTIGIVNGCIPSADYVNWIHNNNRTFVATLRELVTADYTFVILRCPFSRVASTFLDKIVTVKEISMQLCWLSGRRFDPEGMTFREFVDLLKVPELLNSNIHWRPQLDFLVYEFYDDFFQVESFSQVTDKLAKKIGLEITDARGLTKHGLDGLSLNSSDFFGDTSRQVLENMKIGGESPDPRALYDDDIIEAVKTIYADDIRYYTELFGPERLLFK